MCGDLLCAIICTVQSKENNVCVSAPLVMQAASLTVDLCGDDQEPGYCAVSNVAVHTDW